jgi:bifunctional ADP-heptose synthase (sugar kinase/adenylyltransferase)
LGRCNIEHFLHEDASRPTTLKIRYQCQNRTLFRLSKLRHHPIDALSSADIFKQAENFNHLLGLFCMNKNQILNILSESSIKNSRKNNAYLKFIVEFCRCR